MRVTDGKDSFSATVDMSTGEPRELVVRYGADDTVTSRPSSFSPALMWTGFGVGAVGFGVGAVAGISAMAKTNDIKSRCGGTRCTSPTEQAHIDSTLTLGTVSTVGFVVGAVGTGVGIFALVSRPDAPSSRTAMARHAPGVAVGLGPRGAMLQGSF